MTVKLRPPNKIRAKDLTLERELNYTITDIYEKLATLINSHSSNLSLINGDQAFKVGSVYLNTTGVDPLIELGYGVWQRIAQGMLLKGEE